MKAPASATALAATVEVTAAATPAVPLPKPGEIVCHDFRVPAPATTVSSTAGKPLRLVQWNIERGYQLPRIIEELSALDADIIALQEVDIACERSGSLDTGLAIAQALRLNYAFLCEFEELHSPVRTPQLQGGGVHGNAFLSRYGLSELRAVEHTRHPVDWEAGLARVARHEPRRGRRLTFTAVADTPQGPLQLYCAHLEVFCGLLDRVWQLSDIFRDARTSAAVAAAAGGGGRACALLGDLNTMAAGIARLSPKFCCDAKPCLPMRWRSLGWYEAQYWERFVLSVREPVHETNAHLARLGLPPEVCRDAVNPGFDDPFDTVQDVTLDSVDWRLGPLHMFSAKLDWTLLRHLDVVGKSLGNHDYSSSDHKWLCVDVHVSAAATDGM